MFYEGYAQILNSVLSFNLSFQPINTPIYDIFAKDNRNADTLFSHLKRIGSTNASCDDSRVLLGRNARRRLV